MKKPFISVTIADCEVQTFCAGGKGGQHQNATQTGVRVVHRPSGAVGEARDSRSQRQNKEAAFGRMARSGAFRRWLNEQLYNKNNQKSLEETVDEQLNPAKIRVEVQDEEGNWKEE